MTTDPVSATASAHIPVAADYDYTVAAAVATRSAPAVFAGSAGAGGERLDYNSDLVGRNTMKQQIHELVRERHDEKRRETKTHGGAVERSQLEKRTDK